MTHAQRTAAAIALAQEATEVTGDLYLAVIDYSGAETLPTFVIYDEVSNRYHVEGLTEEDVIADVIEVLDLSDAVAADPETYHPDTRAAFGVETAGEREAREREEALAWQAEIEAEMLNEAALDREREARAEYAYAASEALYGASELVF